MSALSPAATIENSPSPQEPRGIYGFVMFTFFCLCNFFYFLWILIPQSWTESWPYEPPQKYWAVAVPILFCTTLFLFAFCIYPAMHSRHDCELNDLSSITDHYAISAKKKAKKLKDTIKETTEHEDIHYKLIQPALDMDLAKVCELLYMEPNNLINE